VEVGNKARSREEHHKASETIELFQTRNAVGETDNSAARHAVNGLP